MVRAAPEESRAVALAERDIELEARLRALSLAGLTVSDETRGYARIFGDLQRAGYAPEEIAAMLVLLEHKDAQAAKEYMGARRTEREQRSAAGQRSGDETSEPLKGRVGRDGTAHHVHRRTD